jgi:hypothetical protein
MGLLNLFKKDQTVQQPVGVIRLPSGSFTIDASGRVVVSTLPRSFPETLVKKISELVLTTFQSAQQAQLPLSEIVAHFATLKLTARELRGGAIIFLAPRTLEKK